MVSKKRDSYSQFTEEYLEEPKYINSLSDDEKVWLNDFFRAYYGRDSKVFNKLNFTPKQRRESYNRHRGVVNDIYNKYSRIYFGGIASDEAMEEIQSLQEIPVGKPND